MAGPLSSVIKLVMACLHRHYSQVATRGPQRAQPSLATNCFLVDCVGRRCIRRQSVTAASRILWKILKESLVAFVRFASGQMACFISPRAIATIGANRKPATTKSYASIHTSCKRQKLQGLTLPFSDPERFR